MHTTTDSHAIIKAMIWWWWREHVCGCTGHPTLLEGYVIWQPAHVGAFEQFRLTKTKTRELSVGCSSKSAVIVYSTNSRQERVCCGTVADTSARGPALHPWVLAKNVKTHHPRNCILTKQNALRKPTKEEALTPRLSRIISHPRLQ